MKPWAFLLVLLLLLTAAAAQNPPTSNPPPRSDREQGSSSSKQTRIDLSPPPGEHGAAPGTESDDINELTPWDPHKAAKHVEVGDYYYKQKNYKAAISRYREALYWKPRDAEATFKLAQALEKSGARDESRKFYQEYLKILPQGEYAEASSKALARLNGPSQAKRK